MIRKNIDDFVIANWEYLTYADMADELSCSFTAVKNACEKLGITPISKSEQTRNFIKWMAPKKTLEELVQMTGWTAEGIRVHLHTLNMQCLEESLKDKCEKYTISQRLSSVTVDVKYGQNNYVPFKLSNNIINEE